MSVVSNSAVMYRCMRASRLDESMFDKRSSWRACASSLSPWMTPTRGGFLPLAWLRLPCCWSRWRRPTLLPPVGWVRAAAGRRHEVARCGAGVAGPCAARRCRSRCATAARCLLQPTSIIGNSQLVKCPVRSRAGPPWPACLAAYSDLRWSRSPCGTRPAAPRHPGPAAPPPCPADGQQAQIAATINIIIDT